MEENETKPLASVEQPGQEQSEETPDIKPRQDFKSILIKEVGGNGKPMMAFDSKTHHVFPFGQNGFMICMIHQEAHVKKGVMQQRFVASLEHYYIDHV